MCTAHVFLPGTRLRAGLGALQATIHLLFTLPWVRTVVITVLLMKNRKLRKAKTFVQATQQVTGKARTDALRRCHQKEMAAGVGVRLALLSPPSSLTSLDWKHQPKPRGFSNTTFYVRLFLIVSGFNFVGLGST